MRLEGGRILYSEDVYVGYWYHKAAGIDFVRTRSPAAGNAIVALIFIAYFFYDIA